MLAIDLDSEWQILILGGAALQRCIEGSLSLRLQPLRYLRGLSPGMTAALNAGLKACSTLTVLMPVYTPSAALCRLMRLITFEDSVRRSRTGALAPDGRIVDLNSACALYLRDVENEGAFYRLADALVPPNMRELFAGGDTSLEAARKALDHVLESDSFPDRTASPSFTRPMRSLSKRRSSPENFSTPLVSRTWTPSSAMKSR